MEFGVEYLPPRDGESVEEMRARVELNQIRLKTAVDLHSSMSDFAMDALKPL